MGTRSTIKFYNNDKFLCGVYQQYDGHTDGVGRELKEFITGGTFVYGFSLNKETKQFNGFDCFVAQFIVNFKKGVGGLYMTTEDDEQEYNYLVKFDGKNIIVSCAEEDGFKQTFKIYDEVGE